MNMCFRQPRCSGIKNIFLLLCIVGLCLSTDAAQAADEDVFLKQIKPSNEQVAGYGHSALWTLSLVATQYQPTKSNAALEAALQAQREDRYVDALILLDKADADAETSLLRASFLLQGNQPLQALEILASMRAQPQHAADAWALTAMANLQLGQMDEALIAANHAEDGGILPHLARSYALQATGHLSKAKDVMKSFNTQTPQQAVALAREAELLLTLNQAHAARMLIDSANRIDAANPYVNAVNGLTFLIEGHPKDAKTAFETALKRDSNDAKALLGLGLAEIRLGNYRAGLGKLQAAHESDPGNALILTYLGRSQQNLGRIAEARASWKSAQLADPKDPTPWLYQAQAELHANRLFDAKNSLREAEARKENRRVYRGDQLIKEDEQLLLANLAEIQRRLGMDNLAFQTIATSGGNNDSTNLRNQADVLQGSRFGESARRSLLLQSMYNERPGMMPATLDIYGDGAGQTGALTPQHGAVSALSPQKTSYNNYDELFVQPNWLEVDATGGSKNTSGEQVRIGAGRDTLGISIAQRIFKSDGYAPFENINNRIGQATVQWQPTRSTQVFFSNQTFSSQRGEMIWPADPLFGNKINVVDNSRVTRLGMRHNLTEETEVRGLISVQQTDQLANYYDFSVPPILFLTVIGSSSTHSNELQFLNRGANHLAQLGMQQTRGITNFFIPTYSFGSDNVQNAQLFYSFWQQTLNPGWRLDAGLDYGKMDQQTTTGSGHTGIGRWLPKLGVVYAPNADTHLRLAAWQGMGIYSVGDATLAPTSLAGILLSRPNDNGQLVRSFALAGDRQLSPSFLLDAKTQRRKTDTPVTDITGLPALFRQQVDESRLALHWQEHSWALNLIYEYEHILNDRRLTTNDSVDEQYLRSQQVAVRWFANEQWAANLTLSHNRVSGTQQLTFNTMLNPFQDDFNQLDADLNWQFNSAGSLTAGIRNASDRRYQYTEIDPLNPRFSKGRMLYGSVKFAW